MHELLLTVWGDSDDGAKYNGASYFIPRQYVGFES